MDSIPPTLKARPGTYSLVPGGRSRTLKVLGWFDLLLGVPLLVISALGLVGLVIGALAGSKINDRVGTLGVVVVITVCSASVVWAGCMMAFKGVHVSHRGLRTPTDLWFRRIRLDDLLAIDIEHSQFRTLHRAVAVAALRDGARVELRPLSAGAKNKVAPILQQQLDTVHQLRDALGIGGSDDAKPADVDASPDAKPVRLLPQERLAWHFLKSRYGRYDNTAAQDIEATHGARGRILLALSALNISCASFLGVALVLVGAGLDVDNIWPWLIPTALLLAAGLVRLAQSSRSKPDTSPGASDTPPPIR